MSDLPKNVRAAAEAIRDSMRKQDAELIESLGVSLGPPTPHPERAHLHTLLHYLGIPDEPPFEESVCGDELPLWGAATRCAHQGGHEMPHRNRYGTEWEPRQ